MNGPTDLEQVDVLPTEPTPTLKWQPIVGSETLSLLESFSQISAPEKEQIKDESIRILGRSTPPSGKPATDTGLVVGYVQSGKTASFTAVAALARDNGYRLVIVVGGTSTPLFDQSVKRLSTDLRFDTRRDRKWQRFENPTAERDRINIRDTLGDWNDPDVPSSARKTVLITVMKNHVHLDNLVQVLSGLPLQSAPTLIIDDEADQAGLNNYVRQDDESTTYQRLCALRALLPHHTFLQYTATPQAPLLINLIDVLSPSFAEVITPGADYVGGKDFFPSQPGAVSLIRSIKQSEVPTSRNVLREPPSSLHQAMRIFFLSVAAGMIVDNAEGNRSMMIHPSQSRSGHTQYFHWVSTAREEWTRILALPVQDPERQELLNEFTESYDDLAATVPSLPAFDELVGRLRHSIRSTKTDIVNSAGGGTPKVDWSAAYSHILVGGQAMDRGFTVEGLTVTYMPRGLGGGNADTIQQRARFFGYKKGYLGYCRVFLEDSVKDAFRHYVEHEEDVRTQLKRHAESGRPLSEWKRRFFLARNLKPTRKSVLSLDYMRVKFGDQWLAPKAPHEPEDAVYVNRKVVAKFLSELAFSEALGHPSRTPVQTHLVATGVSLRAALEKVITRLRLSHPADSQEFTQLALVIRGYLESFPDATCTVYRMSSGTERERTLNEKDEIPNIFQGANYDGDEQIYPGDREIRAAKELTIQIHNLAVGRNAQRVLVPAVAVWVPRAMARDTINQPHPVSGV